MNEKEAKKNLKQVFDASDAEKIVRVIDFSDFLNKNQLDQLSIMTYLNQLRDHFESLSIKEINNKKSTKTYTAPALPTLSVVTTTTTKLMNPFDENDQDETSAETTAPIEINNNQIKAVNWMLKKENFKDKICVRPLNDIHTALNQKREERFKGDFYRNKDEKVSIFSFSEIDDKMRQSVVKNQTDQISFYSFGEIDEIERKKLQPNGGTDEISFNSFTEIDERERNGEQLLIDDDKMTIKSFSQIDESHADTRNKINQMSLSSFDDIENVEGRRLQDQFSINSFREIGEFKKLKTDNFSDDDNDIITVKSFSEINERENGMPRLKNKSLAEKISVDSFTQIDERERKLRTEDLNGNDKYEQKSLNSFGEIDETERRRKDKEEKYRNSSKDSERKKIDPYFKGDEPSILSFKDLDMSEKGKWQNDRISINSFSELELNHKGLLLERSDRRSSIELGAKKTKNVEENSLISSKFGPKDLRLFLNQDINVIRSKKKPFEDKCFLKTLSSIVENRDSQLCLSLKSRLNANKPSDLMRVIKWNRIDVNLTNFNEFSF